MKLITISAALLLSITTMGQQKDSLPKTDTTHFNQGRKLEAVVIRSRKPFIDRQIDKTVMNVQSDIVASSGNVLELLQMAPGVAVVNEETLSMVGKTGVNVLVDGRPTQLSTKDLAAYLKSMPASQVEKIEIITMPSSRYEAQGNAGIINIRLKKSTAKGTNGNASASYNIRRHYEADAAFNLNHRQGKWNWFENTTAGQALQYTDGSILRKVNYNGVDKFFANSTVDQDFDRKLNYLLGADFFASKQHTIGFQVRSNYYSNPMFTPGVTAISSLGKIDSSLQTSHDNLEKNSRINYNFNYKYADTMGKEFNVDVDHIAFNNTGKSFIAADLFNDQDIQYGHTVNSQQSTSQINIYSIKADYTQTIFADVKLEAGAKFNISTTLNKLDAATYTNNLVQPDTGRSNRFSYRENIYAAYAAINQQKGKWEYKLGLRMERSVAKGTSTDLKNNQLNNPDTMYFNLFPSLYIRYRSKDGQQFGFSMAKRLNRPGFQDLNPFEYQFDNYSSYKGNPYLLPEFTQLAEISYSYKGKLDLVLGYSNTNHFFQEVSVQSGQQIQASVYNIGNEYRYYVNASFGFRVTKCWDTYNNLTPFYRRYKGNIEGSSLSNESWGMGWYSSQKFSLSKGYKIQLSSWGSLTTKDAVSTTRSLGSVDAGVSRSFLKDRLTLKLTLLDIFNTQRYDQRVQFGNVDYEYHRKWESRGARLQVTYQFGTNNYRQRERSTGAAEELTRLK